ncbi:alcohol dehydrogenase catalytic domain-containing protein [Candidatus Nitrosocosmicus arcticus]|uniref:Putative NAD-dependent alcohol dehydrogenase n=1 Tax=Candidatus Nitrosocosmicus arcticus TaxID=2035267 RepID=A0A557SYM0_9ARCH|nr:alcohol dehydrogenase catalytic domain-containing protein [Candidatus Nitrosocosmicus arcticus]TVP41698.1 putative NAD-dependent alcohol dehydrogenase [Candidatus Nitrosocosmicus arcticus]
MNAAVYYGPNDIRLENLDFNEACKNDMNLLRVLSCSVCSYDVRTYRNGNFKVTPPVILGHEICAELVEEYKSSNLYLKPQTRVSIYPVIPCLECWYCHKRKFNLCNNLKEVGSTINGGFAEYIAIPKKVFEIGGIIPVSDNITNEEASLIEPLACCINSVNQVKDMEFESAIIFGDGPIGLMQLMLLKRFLKISVTMIGKIKHRLETAKKLGADLVILSDDDSELSNGLNQIKEINGRFSPNLIFISNNNPGCIKSALKLVNKNGRIILFSGFKNKLYHQKKSSSINIDPNFLHYNQVSISGSFSSNPVNLKEAMDLVDSREIDLHSLISNTYSIDKIKEAFNTSESFIGIKSIINDF